MNDIDRGVPADKDLPLKDDIRLLGRILGDTLREQLGLAESPQVGALLAELLRRRRNGELGGREEQLEAARELLAEVAG